MRRAPITPLPRDLGLLVGALERSLGFVVPLLSLSLIRLEAGYTVTPAGGAGTILRSTTDTTDWLDTGADEWRLVGWAVDTAAVGITANYVVNGVTLASATIPPTTPGVFTGAWTRLPTADKPTIDGDQTGNVVLIGNAVGATTIKSLVLEARTVSRTV